MSVVRPFPQRPPEATAGPCNPDAEAAFLGAALIDGAMLDQLPALPLPEDFAEPVNARIWGRILECRARGDAVSGATLRPYFEGDELRYLASLAADGQGLLAPRELAEQITELGARRRWLEWLAREADAARDLDQPLSFSAPPDDGRVAGIVAKPFQWRDPATIPPRPWIFGRWLLLSTVACVVAPGGAGKSTFMAALAVSLASGRAIIGKNLPRGRQRVWLWNLEDDLDELHRSIQAAALHHGIAATDLDDWLYLDSGLEGSTLCTAREDRDGFRLDTGAFRAVEAEIKRREISVLIVDPFVSSHQVNESENGRIDAVAKAWARIAKATSCLILLVHHVSKAGAGDVTATSSRGAVSLINAARSVLVINRMDETEADRLGIPAAERRRYIRIGDDKSNRAPAEAADWFHIASVELGNGDSIGALEPWSLPGVFDDVTLDHLRAVQARIDERNWRENHQAKDWAGLLIGEVLGVDVRAKPGKSKVSAILSEWIRTAALRIEERPDRNREMRRFVVMGEPA